MKIKKIWLTLNEAANLISNNKSEKNAKDMLFLILEYKLRAYCVLKTSTDANCYRLKINFDKINNVMIDAERVWCGYRVFSTFMPLDTTDIYNLAAKGIYEKVSVCEFDSDPLEGFDDRENDESWTLKKSLVVKTEDVVILGDDFFACLEKENNKILVKTERETLLVIIAALTKEAKIDYTKTSKAGVIIENLTQQLGSSVSATAVERHFKQIPQALENRAK